MDRTLKNRLRLTTALIGTALLGCGSNAYADCRLTTGNNVLCSGQNTTQQSFNRDNTTVTTEPGFSVKSDRSALFFVGKGDMAYVDANGASLEATGSSALEVRSLEGSDPGHGSVTINANGRIAGYGWGISTQNHGFGSTVITTTGDVTAARGTGIQARNTSSASDLIINAGNVSGYIAGIDAGNDGSGKTSITATGAVDAVQSTGIRVKNAVGSNGLIVNAAKVTAGREGIVAYNMGSGDTSVTVTGDISANTLGLWAYGGKGSQNLIVKTGKVSAGTEGVSVHNRGTGDTAITITGAIETKREEGIRTSAESGSLNVNAMAVRGGMGGIIARHYGTGDVSITATGDVTGGDYLGVYAEAHSGIVNVTAGNIQASRGIRVYQDGGEGDANIVSSGTINASNGHGIEVLGKSSAGDKRIRVANVSATDFGIWVEQPGRGISSISVTGDVRGGRGGVFAQSKDKAKGIDIRIDATGSVRGGDLFGAVAVQNGGSGVTRITNAGTIANLSGKSSDRAITSAGEALTLTNTGAITGVVNFSAEFQDGVSKVSGDNVFENGGVWNTAGGVNEFGAGNDTLFNTGTINAASNAAVAETTQFNGLETFVNKASGVLNLQDGGVGDIVRISGDYAGEGGAVRMDTQLGGDNSPTDMVVIGGNVSGNSRLFVNNVGGTGAQTLNGIKVIDVKGTSTASNFVLAAPVEAGAYAYRLQQKPSDQSFYLLSDLKAGDPGNPGAPGNPANSGNPGVPTIPLYSSGVPLYENLPQVLQLLNRPGTLQQRVGNRYWQTTGNDVNATAHAVSGGDGKPIINDNGIWARIEGAHNVSDPSLSTSSATFNADTWKLQSGADFQFAETDGGRLIGGIFAEYGQAMAKVRSPHGNGNIDTNGYGLGANLTWYGDSGLYVDGLAKYTWYDSDLSSDTTGSRLAKGVNGSGYALSVEAGKRLQVGNGLILTPQAQLAYSSVDFDTFTDKARASVSLDQGDSLRGRLGLNLEKQTSFTASDGTTSRVSVYGTADLFYEFLDGSKVDVSGVRFANRDDRLWGGLGIGGSYNWKDEKYSLYGEASINSSLENKGSYAVSGNLGMRVHW